MLAYSTFKEIHALFKQGHFEAAQRILMKLQARYIALCDEVSMLKKQVQEFEDILFLSQNLVEEGEQYWLRAGAIKHGPFCKSCYEYTGKLVRLASHKNVWRCPYCGLLQSRVQTAHPAFADHSSLGQQGKILPFRFPQKTC